MKICRLFKKTLAFSVALCFFAVISWVAMPARVQAAAAGTRISDGSDDQPNYVVRESASRHFKKKAHSLLPWIVGGAVVLTVALVLLLKKKSSGGDGSVTVSKFGGHGTADGLFDDPEGIALDSSGNVYVSDYNNERIQKFTANGVFLKKWGLPSGMHPRGLTVFGNRLYVCDIKNYSDVQVFDLEGNHQATWKVPDYNTSQSFVGALDVDADSAGNIYVLDTQNVEVVIFGSSGNVKGHFSTEATRHIPRCVGIAISGNQIFLTDGVYNQVNVFDLNGTFLRSWGQTGSASGQFVTASGIAIMKGNSLIVGDFPVSPTLPRIQKFDFSGGYQGTIQPAQGGYYPRYLAVNDKAGKIYICAASGDEILVADTF
jgi:hypothetical protein